MSKISPEQIKHIAELARVNISANDIKNLSEELTDILDFIGILKKTQDIDISEGEQVMDVKNIFRRDEEHGELKEKGSGLIKLAPKTKDSQVLAPYVLDNTQL